MKLDRLDLEKELEVGDVVSDGSGHCFMIVADADCYGLVSLDSGEMQILSEGLTFISSKNHLVELLKKQEFKKLTGDFKVHLEQHVVNLAVSQEGLFLFTMPLFRLKIFWADFCKFI